MILDAYETAKVNEGSFTRLREKKSIGLTVWTILLHIYFLQSSGPRRKRKPSSLCKILFKNYGMLQYV